MYIDDQKYNIFGRLQATKPALYRYCVRQCPIRYMVLYTIGYIICPYICFNHQLSN